MQLEDENKLPWVCDLGSHPGRMQSCSVFYAHSAKAKMMYQVKIAEDNKQPLIVNICEKEKWNEVEGKYHN